MYSEPVACILNLSYDSHGYSILNQLFYSRKKKENISSYHNGSYLRASSLDFHVIFLVFLVLLFVVMLPNQQTCLCTLSICLFGCFGELFYHLYE